MSAALLVLFLVPSMPHATDGQDLFVEEKCDRCHAIASLGIEATTKSDRMRGPDLGETDQQRTAEWIVRYVAKQIELDGKSHRTTYKGTQENLEAIAKWLSQLDGQ